MPLASRRIRAECSARAEAEQEAAMQSCSTSIMLLADNRQQVVYAAP